MSAARAAPGPDRGLTGVAGLLLLGAVAVGLVGQGAHYGTVQRLVGLLVAAAALLAMVARPPDREDARLLPVVPALALVVWALADAVLLGLPSAGAAGLGLLVAGLLAVLFVCRRLGPEDRELLVAGVVAGALVALAGLVPSMPAAAPPRPAVALAGLAAGLALSVLVAGPAGRVWPRGGRPLGGGPWPRPARLLGGGPWPRPARLLAGVALVALLGGLALVGGGQAFRAVAGARVGLDSPDRTGALLAARQVLADHPLTGAGPGQARLRWEGSDGVTHLYAYVHNEYVQVAAELGLVGLALLGLLVAAWARLLWRSRPVGAGAAPGPVWSRGPPPSPSTAASTSSGTCRRSCSP